MTQKGKYYRAPWDSKAIEKSWIYLAVFLILLSIFFVYPNLLDFISNTYDVRWAMIFFFVTCVFFIVGIFSVFDIPTGYFIQNDAIIVRRIFVNKNIHFLEIKSVEYQDEIKRGIEIFPRPYLGHRNETEISLFGYSGNFRIKTYGKIYSYCNRWNRFVMIKSKDNYSYLLSPENRHEFIQDASKALREWKIQEKVCECPVCGVALKDMDHVCHRCGAEYMNVYKF